MTTPLSKWLFWAPRGMGILLALFTSLFALDVFSLPGPLLEQISGLLVHLIPTCLVVIALVVGWRWELPGGLLFIALAGLYLATINTGIPLEMKLILANFPILAGALFLVDWAYRRGKPTGQG